MWRRSRSLQSKLSTADILIRSIHIQYTSFMEGHLGFYVREVEVDLEFRQLQVAWQLFARVFLGGGGVQLFVY